MSRPMRLFSFYVSEPWDIDAAGFVMCLGLILRPDLMRDRDQGMYVLAGFEARLIVGRSHTAIEGRAPFWRGWIFRFYTRSDIGEILRRAQAEEADA